MGYQAGCHAEAEGEEDGDSGILKDGGGEGEAWDVGHLGKGDEWDGEGEGCAEGINDEVSGVPVVFIDSESLNEHAGKVDKLSTTVSSPSKMTLLDRANGRVGVVNQSHARPVRLPLIELNIRNISWALRSL